MKIKPMVYEEFDLPEKKEYSLPVNHDEAYQLGLIDNNDNLIYSNTD